MKKIEIYIRRWRKWRE